MWKRGPVWLGLRRQDLAGAVLILLVVVGFAAWVFWHGRQTGMHMADPNWPCYYGPKGVVCGSQGERQ